MPKISMGLGSAFRFSLTILAVNLVMACGGLACVPAKAARQAETSRISLLHYFSGSLSGGIDSLVSSFNKANPGHLLIATPLDHESFKSSIGDTLKSGDPPDIYSYWAGAKTRDILPALQPIDDLWKDAGLDATFPSALVDSACRYDGAAYLLPITQHFVGFFYNKALFLKAGVTPPADWASFLVACAKLKAKGIVPLALGADAQWPAQFWFDYILLRTAGSGFRERLMEGKASWTDAEVIRTFSLWHDLVAAGFFNDKPNENAWDSGAAVQVSDGKAAMTLMGTWIIGTWNGLAPDWKDGRDYGVFPFPAIDPGVPACALGPVDGLVIPKAAKNPAGARKVLRYLAEAAPQEAMSQGSGAMAPSLAVPPSSYSGIRNEIRAIIAAAPLWAFNYNLATPPERSAIGLALFSEFLGFPDRYRELLGQAELKMRSLASSAKN